MSILNDNLPAFHILVEGVPILDSYQVVSIVVNSEVNRIASATITLFESGDGLPLQNFPASDGASFTPGLEVIIAAGFGMETEPIFTGMIISQRLSAGQGSAPQLVVECKSRAVRMTIGRKSKIYPPESPDMLIMEELIASYELAPIVEDVEDAPRAEAVQYNCTDWDFLVTRADVNGMVVICEGPSIIVKPPITLVPSLELTYGMDIISFDFVMDARTQYTEVKAAGWNPELQMMGEGIGVPPIPPEQGDMLGTELSIFTSPEPFSLTTAAPINEAGLEIWASAQLMKSRFAKIRGTVKAKGSPGVKPGGTVTLLNVGTKFSGDAYVSGVTHELSAGSFVTTIQIGLDQHWWAERVKPSGPPAAGLLPGVRGLVTAKVLDITDPEFLDRVLVEVPTLGIEGEPVFARLAKLYASEDCGTFFMPEVGDEVILGFINEDPRFPVILGSMHNMESPPPYPPVEGINPIKAIVSKTQLKIEFDEVESTLTIITPAMKQVVLNDIEDSITITDLENTITMNPEGITMESLGIISIETESEVMISGEAGVTINSAADVNIVSEGEALVSGLNVTIEGEVGIEMSGALTEIAAEGMLAIEAGLTTIE